MSRKLFSGEVALRTGPAAPIVNVAAALFLALALVATCGYASADTYLQKLGGSGGGKFVGRCPANENLAGFDLQTGDWIDSIRPLCVTAFGPTDVGPIDGLDDAFGAGNSGNRERIVCPTNAPIVTGLDVGWEGVNTITVSQIQLLCGVAASRQTTQGGLEPFVAPGHVFEGGNRGADLNMVSISGPKNLQAGVSGTYTITIANVGTSSATVELAILFAKTLDETGQVVPSANGLACGNVGTGGPINAQLNCTGGQLAAGETGTVIVQARGQIAGAGMLIGTLNNSRTLQESDYNNNLKQFDVTIN